MTTRSFLMPKSPSIGRATQDGVFLNDAYRVYLGGIEDMSKRVSANVAILDGDTTAANISAKLDAVINAMIAANLMKAE